MAQVIHPGECPRRARVRGQRRASAQTKALNHPYINGSAQAKSDPQLLWVVGLVTGRSDIKKNSSSEGPSQQVAALFYPTPACCPAHLNKSITSPPAGRVAPGQCCAPCTCAQTAMKSHRRIVATHAMHDNSIIDREPVLSPSELHEHRVECLINKKSLLVAYRCLVMQGQTTAV
jgi:hypothetical protein